VSIGSFFAELKRRNVYKVAVAYAVAGWALAQGIAQVFPVFDIPNWAVRLVVLAIIIGFPIALVIAWAFELTPEGIKRTEDIGPAVDSRAKSRAWIYVAIVAALLSISLFFLGRFTARNSTGAFAISACTAKMSLSSRSKVRDQSWIPSAALISSATIRTLSPCFRTVPSSSVLTPSFSPMVFGSSFVSLKRNEELRPITLSSLI
jgi:hypothetical protein